MTRHIASTSFEEKAFESQRRFMFYDSTSIQANTGGESVSTRGLVSSLNEQTGNARHLNQADEIEVRGINTERWRPSADESPSEESRVLERFLGLVESVDGETAYVKLTTPDDVEMYGSYSAVTLKAKGIVAGDWFECDTIKLGSEVTVEIRKRRRIPLSEAMMRRMSTELNEQLDGME